MASNAKLNTPNNVFVSPIGEVYIADTGNHRIRKILIDGNIVTIAGNGEQGYSGDGGPATDCQLDSPKNVFVSLDCEVYISDDRNHRIRKILTNGNIVTIAGTGEAGYSGDNDLATNAQLNSPSFVFVSPKREIYISDTGNHCIRKILTDGNIVTIAGNGQQGYGNGGEDGPATDCQLDTPLGICVSQNDEVFIAEFGGHRIRKILTNGNIVRVAGTGQRGFNGIDFGAKLKLDCPGSVVISPNNEVYIVDTFNQRIRKISESGMIVSVAGNGGAGYGGDNNLATDARFYLPTGAFVSQNGEIYVADSENHCIRKILTSGIIVTIAGNGNSGFKGDSEFDFTKYPHILE